MSTEKTEIINTVIAGPYHPPCPLGRKSQVSDAWLRFRPINNVQHSGAFNGLCCRWILKNERYERRLVAVWTDN
jgi:hypothetical protein